MYSELEFEMDEWQYAIRFSKKLDVVLTEVKNEEDPVEIYGHLNVLVTGIVSYLIGQQRPGVDQKEHGANEKAIFLSLTLLS